MAPTADAATRAASLELSRAISATARSRLDFSDDNASRSCLMNSICAT